MKAKLARPVFYGWWIAIAATITITVATGIGHFAFAVGFPYFIDEFGWSRAAVSAALTIFYLTGGVLAPILGRLCDRHGSQRVMLASALPFGAAVILLSQVQSLGQLYAVCILVAMTAAGLRHVPVGTMITRWFIRKRGQAMAIAITGTSLGGVVLAPLSGYLMAGLGWRPTFLSLGLMAWAILLPLTTLVIRSRPQDMGLLPDGRTLAPAEASAPTSKPRPALQAAQPARDWTLAQALQGPTFWLISLAFMLVSITEIAILAHQVPFLMDVGIPPTTAATALGLVSGMEIVGMLTIGYLADRLPKVYLALLCFAIQGMGVAILMQTRSLGMIWLFVTVFGVAAGGAVAMRPLLAGHFFGQASFGGIYGGVESLRHLTAAFGPLLAGYIFDVSGSYQWAFIFMLMACLGAILSLFTAQQLKPKATLDGLSIGV